MPLIIRLPNGETASFPDGTNPDIAAARIAADNPKLFPDMGKQTLRRNTLVAEGDRKPDEYTTGDRFRKAFNDFESQSGEFRGLIEDRLGNPNEGTGLARIAANRLQAKDAESIAPPAMDYRDISGIGSFGSFLGQNLIQSAPQMTSSALGAAGAIATLPVSAPTALAAGLGAGALVNLPSYGGQNIDDQIRELVRAGLTEEQALQKIKLGPAAVSGALQAGLDALPIATAVGKPLVSVGKPVLESVGKKIAATKIGENAAARFAGRVGMRAGETAVDEAASEALQQALQIGQSGYVTDEGIGSALARRSGEIGDAAIAGGLIGGGLGGAGHVVFPNRPSSDRPTVPPTDTPPPIAPADMAVGRRGTFVYDGEQHDGVITGFSQYGLPVFYSKDGIQRQVKPGDILAMQEEQALLPKYDNTLYSGQAGTGTNTAMDALRKQIAPLLPEERQPQAGGQYSALQQQIIDYQNKEADRRAAEEDALQKRIEQQNKEALDQKRQQDAELLASEQLATKVAETRVADITDTPRLTYDSTLAVTPEGVAIPRGQVIQQTAQEKQAKRDAAQKRIDDGFDPSVEAPAQVIDRAPLPPEPLPKAPAVAKPAPDFEAGPLVKNKHADYTQPSKQARKWIQGTVAELNDTSGGQRVFLEADRQGSTANVVGGKGNTPSWFSSYNNAAVDAQKNRAKTNKKNMTLEDSKKAALESVPQILTRQKVTEVANKILEGRPLGKAEVKVAEVIYGEAKAAREQNARQIVSQREGRAIAQQEELGDAAEPDLPPRDTSLDDIPFDIPVTKKPDSTQRFKSDAAFNQRAAERGVVTSKVIEDAGYHDPLTGSSFFPEDSTIDPRALDSKIDTKKNNKWRKEKIEVTTEDGTKAKVAAGDITSALKSRAEILQKLKACLG